MNTIIIGQSLPSLSRLLAYSKYLANTFSTDKPIALGQSDIKKLRRENAQLKKEIWTLRDEYDRLGKILTTKNRPIRDYDGTVTTTDCHYDDGCDYDDEGMDHCSCGCLSNEVCFYLLNCSHQSLRCLNIEIFNFSDIPSYFSNRTIFPVIFAIIMIHTPKTIAN